MKIGYAILIRDDPDLKRPLTYKETRDTALRAEELGLDSVWLFDHLFYRSPEKGTTGIWECWTFLSALAEVTKRVEIGTLVLCTQFRNPAILAKMAHTIDEVSGGRLVLGIGAGWNEPEFKAFGIPFDHLVSRFEEAVQVIRPLLREGRVDFEGQYYQVRDCEIAPRGPRPEGPPLLIGGEGPRMRKLVAQYADIWNYAYTAQPAETFAGPKAEMEASCREVGRDPATLEYTALAALAFPDLGPKSPWMEETGYLTGSAEELAAAMRGYEELGCSHLMFQAAPYVPEVLERLGEAVRVYRQ